MFLRVRRLLRRLARYSTMWVHDLFSNSHEGSSAPGTLGGVESSPGTLSAWLLSRRRRSAQRRRRRCCGNTAVEAFSTNCLRNSPETMETWCPDALRLAVTTSLHRLPRHRHSTNMFAPSASSCAGSFPFVSALRVVLALPRRSADIKILLYRNFLRSHDPLRRCRPGGGRQRDHDSFQMVEAAGLVRRAIPLAELLGWPGFVVHVEIVRDVKARATGEINVGIFVVRPRYVAREVSTRV